VFCSKDIFQRTVTFRSPANVIMEIDALVKTFGIRQLDILDDNFAIETVAHGAYPRRDHSNGASSLPSICNWVFGPRSWTRRFWRKMKAAGIFKTFPSALNQRIRTCLHYAKRRIDLDTIERITAMARKAGFRGVWIFHHRATGETTIRFRTTIDFAKRCDFDVANFTPWRSVSRHSAFPDNELTGRFLLTRREDIDSGFFLADAVLHAPDTTAAEYVAHTGSRTKRFTHGKRGWP